MSTVRGVLVLPADAPTSSGVHIVVRLRDITFSDAPAPVQQIDMLADIAPGARIPFALEVADEWLTGARRTSELNLEAHVDRDANGIFSRGDLVSMRAHPVDAAAVGTEQEVALVLV
jgi:putative lipoprotein